MTDIEKRIYDIVRAAEDVERSRESTYTKDCAKISAYGDIKEIIMTAFKEAAHD